MSRTSDSVTAVSNDNYRNNSFWDKGKKGGKVEADEKPTRGDSGGKSPVGADGGNSGTANSGDDE